MASLLDSYSESNVDSSEGKLSAESGNLMIGQSFEGNGKTLDSAKFYLRKHGTPPGNVFVEIYAHSGTYGTSSIGTGSPLATSDTILATSLPSSLGLVDFAFSGGNRITLGNGTRYVIVVNYSDAGGNFSNNVRFAWDQSSPTHAGNYIYYSSGGGWGYSNTRDLPFYVYVENTVITNTYSETMGVTDTLVRSFSRIISESLSITSWLSLPGIKKLLGKVAKGVPIIGRIADAFKNKGSIKEGVSGRGRVK